MGASALQAAADPVNSPVRQLLAMPQPSAFGPAYRATHGTFKTNGSVDRVQVRPMPWAEGPQPLQHIVSVHLTLATDPSPDLFCVTVGAIEGDTFEIKSWRLQDGALVSAPDHASATVFWTVIGS